jgi:hypothetical protein
MTKSALETITKLDAAKRQFQTAIRLLFSNADTVSIHTLVTSAHQIVHDMSGRKSQILNSPEIKKEFHKEVNDFIRAPQNFFKHAEEGQNNKIQFSPMFSHILLYDGIYLYWSLAKVMFREGSAFLFWLFLSYTNLVIMPEVKKIAEEAKQLGLDPEDRKMFLELLDHPAAKKYDDVPWKPIVLPTIEKL